MAEEDTVVTADGNDPERGIRARLYEVRSAGGISIGSQLAVIWLVPTLLGSADVGAFAEVAAPQWREDRPRRFHVRVIERINSQAAEEAGKYS